MRAVTKPDHTGRARAERLFPDEQPCEVCGKAGKGRGVIDRHHRNSDRMDNRAENIAFLCRKHHLAAHRDSDGKVGGGPRPRVAALMRDRAVERAHQAAVMRDHGASVDDIAREMGVDKWSVHRWFRKYRCIFDGCVSMDRHWHYGFPGGYDNPADPEGPPIPFTFEPEPGVRDYNGALLRTEVTP